MYTFQTDILSGAKITPCSGVVSEGKDGTRPCSSSGSSPYVPLLVTCLGLFPEIEEEFPRRATFGDTHEVAVRGHESGESEGPCRRDGACILAADEDHEVPGQAEVRLEHEMSALKY